MRKGFTLVELLIVLAVLGSLSAMMTGASSDAIDTSTANAILGNLQTLKAAAFEMYMENPDVASITPIDESKTIGSSTKKVGELLGEKYLGKKDLGVYKLIGSGSAWYVYYTLGEAENVNVRAKLKAKADAAGLWATTTAPSATSTTTPETGDPVISPVDNCGFSVYYDDATITEATADATVYIALKVR